MCNVLLELKLALRIRTNSVLAVASEISDQTTRLATLHGHPMFLGTLHTYIFHPVFVIVLWCTRN